MKTINFIIILLISSYFSFAQNNKINAITKKNYTFSEVYGSNNYACNITFKKENRDSIITVLNNFFENSEISKNKITWKNLIGTTDNKDHLLIELKSKSLKIDWKDNSNNRELVEKFKLISKEIVEILNN